MVKSERRLEEEGRGRKKRKDKQPGIERWVGKREGAGSWNSDKGWAEAQAQSMDGASVRSAPGKQVDFSKSERDWDMGG
jgi:hypothetical protein